MVIAIISDKFLVVLLNIRKITKGNRALINVLRQEKNWSSQRLLRKFSGKNWAKTCMNCNSVIPLAWQNVCKAVGVRDQFARHNFGKHRTCGGAHLQSRNCSARIQKSVPVNKLQRRRTFHGRLFGALQSMIFGRKSTSTCQGYCHSIDDASLFFQVDSSKLWSYVKNERAFICAEFGVNRINTSNVTMP